MLTYHGYGPRRYHAKPVRATARATFEFQAVVRGSISIVTPEGAGLLRRRWLWLCAPGFAHGWTASAEESAEVVVFHFRFIPVVLEQIVGKGGMVELELSPAQCRRLKALSAQALRYYDPPSAGTPLCHEQILMELSLMVLENSGGIATLPPDDAARRVEEAMRWFAKRMEQNPPLDEIAAAVGCSVATLRRHFRHVMKTSPKETLDRIRFQRAMQLLQERQIKIEAIGESCGFGSASAFSRAFKHKVGVCPEVWRAK